MKYRYRDCEIFYKFFDKESSVVNVFLHGWANDHNSLLFCNEVLLDSCLFIDFPPFGQSGEVEGWSIFTYANMVISLCQHLKLKKINLIGHSFGGRVGIIISVFQKELVDRLMLIDSAGLKPKRGIKYRWKVFDYKVKRKLGKDISNYGSSDYKNLNPQMKKVFISIVNTHLDEFLPFVKAKTLIVFGEKDVDTPLYMARKLHRKIKNSELVILKDAGHFCFLDRKFEFVMLLEKFLNVGENYVCTL